MKGMRSLLVIGLWVALAAVLRLDLLIAHGFVIDSDEAIVGLMAKHITEGAPIPAFYYGQHYMGSLEPIMVSLLFQITGISTVALKVLPLLFSLVLVVLVYQLGKEFGGERVGVIASLLTAVCPSTLVVWSSMARGGFIELIVIGVLALLITVRGWNHHSLTPSRVAVIAFILGVGWWVNNQIIYFFIPIGALILAEIRARSDRFLGSLFETARYAACFLPLFLLGGAPSWIHHIRLQFPVGRMFEVEAFPVVLRHLEGVFSTSLPILLGAQRFWGKSELYPGAHALVALVYLLPLLALWAIRWRQFARALLFRFERGAPLEVLYLFVMGVITVFCLSTYGKLLDAPRYLLPLYPAIFVMLAAALVQFQQLVRIPRMLSVLPVLLVNLFSSYPGGERAIPGEPIIAFGERVSKDHRELIEWLDRRGTRFVATNYWVGYRLALETGERVRFRMFQLPQEIRIPSYQIDSRRVASREVPMVLSPRQGAIVKRALKAMGAEFEEVRLSGYSVLYNIDRHDDSRCGSGTVVPPEGLTAVASTPAFDPAAAFDGDIATRWGSGAPQRPGMTFEISLSPARRLKGIHYDLGMWSADFPRALKIEVIDTQGNRREALAGEQYESLRYFLLGEPISFCFAPLEAKKVILTQEGRDPVFDWSIGELSLLE